MAARGGMHADFLYLGWLGRGYGELPGHNPTLIRHGLYADPIGARLAGQAPLCWKGLYDVQAVRTRASGSDVGNGDAVDRFLVANLSRSTVRPMLMARSNRKPRATACTIPEILESYAYLQNGKQCPSWNLPPSRSDGSHGGSS